MYAENSEVKKLEVNILYMYIKQIQAFTMALYWWGHCYISAEPCVLQSIQGSYIDIIFMMQHFIYI